MCVGVRVSVCAFVIMLMHGSIERVCCVDVLQERGVDLELHVLMLDVEQRSINRSRQTCMAWISINREYVCCL